MFPVNSMQASAPLCMHGQILDNQAHTGRTWFGGDISLWYIGTIVLAKVKPFILDHKLAINDNTYDSKPTPKPAITRPTTITQKPGVKV